MSDYKPNGRRSLGRPEMKWKGAIKRMQQATKLDAEKKVLSRVSD
jgi:hypothetical protein